jgi:midasin
VNTHSCFFGRSVNMRREEVEEEEEKEKRFVYTATTLRLMEQISLAITHSEAALLVGETGTGKTTSVQELAKLLGKTFHVFNMN